jgi:hypothetical protein
MEHKLHSVGGAADQLGQLGLSEMDLLKLAASGTLGQHGYNTRSHSAEVAHHPQHPGMQPTFSPSWPPHGLGGSAERDAAAAAALAAAHAGHHPLMPPSGAYFPTASLSAGAAGLGGHGSLGGAADLTYLAQLGAVGTSGALLAGAAASSAAFGEGPRIYVGGVPDLVTVAMVRDHFSRWGVVRNLPLARITLDNYSLTTCASRAACTTVSSSHLSIVVVLASCFTPVCVSVHPA